MVEAILLAIAIGVIVPVVLLLGPYLPYLRPVRNRLPDPEKNRFAETLTAALCAGAEREP